jgi:hypothetical protein
MEMQRFDKFLNSISTEFQTYLPIQLDGTCNGFQHLALLSNETEMFESLNLNASNKDEDPQDFYENIIVFINIHIEIKLNELKSKLDNIKSNISNLNKKVDLTDFSNFDKVLDEHNEIRTEPIHEKYNKLITEYNEISELYCSYVRLKDLKLNRKIIKSAIMTIPYNASLLSLIKYIKENLIFDHYEEVKIWDKGECYTYTKG